MRVYSALHINSVARLLLSVNWVSSPYKPTAIEAGGFVIRQSLYYVIVYQYDCPDAQFINSSVRARHLKVRLEAPTAEKSAHNRSSVLRSHA
jgi:hypothetical protein